MVYNALNSWVSAISPLSYILNNLKAYNNTPWPSVRERTIPTNRPPLVDEI
jgi:hypothetical protein